MNARALGVSMSGNYAKKLADRLIPLARGWDLDSAGIPIITRGSCSFRPFAKEDLAEAFERLRGGRYVYFVECGGRVKIGYSSDPSFRLRTLRTYAPFPLRVLGYLTVESKEAEAKLHERFRHLRVWPNREWFHLGIDLRVFIARAMQLEEPKAAS